MKKIYIIYASIFVLIFLIEFMFYMTFNSTTLGLIYTIINLIASFLLILTSKNYNDNNINLRISKNIFLIILMVFSILLTLFNYKDESLLYIDKIKIFVYYIKPIFIVLLVVVSLLEFKFKKKRYNKIN